MREQMEFGLSVFIILVRANEVLMLRRANTGWEDGAWSLPAGRVEGNELLAQAAARELREETGLIAEPDTLRLAHILHCRAGDSGREWLGAFFIAPVWQGQAKLMEPDKHDAMAWQPLNDLPATTIAYTRQGLQYALRGELFSGFGWR